MEMVVCMYIITLDSRLSDESGDNIMCCMTKRDMYYYTLIIFINVFTCCAQIYMTAAQLLFLLPNQYRMQGYSGMATALHACTYARQQAKRDKM
jgi:hypothetical protein